MGYFGVQADQPTPRAAWAEPAFSGPWTPLHRDQGSFVDSHGIMNYVYAAYWRESSYLKWWQAQQDWWQSDDRTKSGHGYWREVVLIPFTHFETLHSTPSPHGLGSTADGLSGPILEHGYPGAARDRIALSSREDLDNPIDMKPGMSATQQNNGARIIVTPPEKICLIRSGQDWSQCDQQQQDYYLTEVHPSLKEGMKFLQENPLETNCYNMQLINSKDKDWKDIKQSFGMGYAVDILAFENWAKSHPTHLKIFARFMAMIEKFGTNLALQLWHEVIILPAQGCEFEYINCHPKTGMLPYAKL